MNTVHEETLDPGSATEIAERSAGLFQQTLGDRLIAAYALGSLAHGGFAPAVSDIDLALVLTDRRHDDEQTVQAVHRLHRSRDQRSPAVPEEPPILPVGTPCKLLRTRILGGVINQCQ